MLKELMERLMHRQIRPDRQVQLLNILPTYEAEVEAAMEEIMNKDLQEGEEHCWPRKTLTADSETPMIVEIRRML
jgi:hypothetical protein